MTLDRRKQLIENLEHQKERLARAAALAGRSQESVQLLAVSKTYPAEDIEFLYDAGQRDFGENYVQELAEKAVALAHLPELRFHLIGHLQTNKAKIVAPFVDSIQTVSSERLVLELEKRVREKRSPEKSPLRIFLEVNIGGEQQKSGCRPDEVAPLLELLGKSDVLRAVGLMTVPPATEDPEDAYPYFEKLRKLRDEVGGAQVLPELSMGMSSDAEAAIRAGATWVRIGSAIFGSRAKKEQAS